MSASAERGFAGSVTAHSVADVLQFNGANRFSGSITVSHRGQKATLFMQHGEVVHAECGALRGEAAFGAVMAWPAGNFEAHANIATFSRTIDKRLDHLLLDAARYIDEARRDGVPVAPQGAEPSRPALPPAAERTLTVPGVTYAAVLRGGVATGDGSPEAATLAARSIFLLSMLANPLGKALGLGEVSRVSFATHQDGQLLLLQSKDAYLAVAVDAEAPMAETEAAIRKALSPRSGS